MIHFKFLKEELKYSYSLEQC